MKPKQSIFSLFLITFLMGGFFQPLSLAEIESDTDEIAAQEQVAEQGLEQEQEETDGKSMILYQRAFSLATGKSIRVRPYYQEEKSNGYQEGVESALAARIAILSRREVSEPSSYAIGGEGIFDVNNAKEDLVEFTFVDWDRISRFEKTESWQPDYYSSGATLFRIHPDKVIRTKEGKRYLNLGHDDLLDIRWSMPVWEVGKNAPARVMFGPKFSTALVQEHMSAEQGLKQDYPSRNLKYANAFGGRVLVGANALLFLGRDVKSAWQLGASAYVSESRSFGSGTDKHRIEGNGYSIFLYSPEYYNGGVPTQFYLQWSQENLNVDSYVGEGFGSDLNYLELPEFDYENQSVEWGMIIWL